MAGHQAGLRFAERGEASNSSGSGGGGGGGGGGGTGPRRSVPQVSVFEMASMVTAWSVDRESLHVGPALSGGSQAVVFSGRYADQMVAIKVMRVEKMASQRVYSDFVNECGVLHAVSHPHVLRFVGVCVEPPNLCLVTEYMAGGSLFDLLHGTGVVLRLAADVVSGMEFVHSRNIIHRDLKSANLLLTTDNRVKVADFGVACRLAPAGDMTAETGTYRWMAPEMILRLPYDSKVDVYSFGIVLYELLSGRVPYAELEPMVATNEVSRRGLRPPVPREAGPGLGRLMTRCWCSPAGERPSFTEVGAALPELTAEADEAAQRGAQPFSWTGASSWLARAGGSLRGRRPPG